MDHLKQLIEQQLTKNHEAFIIFSDINIRYLTGFSGHAATLVVSPKQSTLITDYRYVEQAKQQVSSEINVLCRDRAKQSLPVCIHQVLQQLDCQKVFFEAEQISVAAWQQIAIELQHLTTRPRTLAVETLRYVKTPNEVKAIKAAAHIADQALETILPQVKIGISEKELALELDYQMQKLGAQGLSFDTILLFGERSALPHGVPSTRTLQRGDLILIDFGVVIDGYRSDMTRTYVCGQASDKQKQVHQTVLAAQQAALCKVTAGMKGKTLQQIADEVLLASEFAQYKGEGLGHGVGLVLHEQPFIDPNCELSLQAGNVITIEPGIYIPNWGGVRIEDDVLITENSIEILTHAPKELLSLGA